VLGEISIKSKPSEAALSKASFIVKTPRLTPSLEITLTSFARI
jgi:hypothetical protein